MSRTLSANSFIRPNLTHICDCIYLYSFSDRPATPQTSAATANHTNTLNASMQSPRQNATTTAKESVPTNNMIRNTNAAGKIPIILKVN